MSDEDPQAWYPIVPSSETKIWRYIDFTQFVSILDRRALWFGRADKFKDPLEGSFSRATVDTRELRYEDSDIPIESLNKLAEAFRTYRKCAFMNCWHRSSYESAAMWDLYSIQNQGIAIRSTVGRLHDALTRNHNAIVEGQDIPEDRDIDYIFIIGNVRYIDFDKHFVPENWLPAPLFHKRQSYEHEKELRVLFSKNFTEVVTGEKPPSDIMEPGEYVPVDLDILIDELYVSPTSDDWFHNLVESVIDQYEFDIDPIRSNLDTDPVF